MKGKCWRNKTSTGAVSQKLPGLTVTTVEKPMYR